MSPARLPEKLLRAKRVAVAQFISETTTLPRLTTFAVSTRPDHNVVGVGIGHKITQGQSTSKRCIRLYVDRKIPQEVIPRDCLLPPRIDGIPTDGPAGASRQKPTVSDSNCVVKPKFLGEMRPVICG